jgi:nucleotide-binding universal stress UspA family protein
MAAHGKHALERLLVGSETQRVLQLSDIPVLVWRE